MFTKRSWVVLLMMTGLLAALELLSGSDADAQTTTPAIPAPILTLSVNQPSGGASFNGWPLVIQVDLYHPDFAVDDAAVTPIPLNLSSGSWADAVSITVTDNAGTQVSWPLHQVLRPTGTDASITLDAETSGHLVWWVSPADTAGLTAGSFQIAAVLDTSTVTDPTVFQGQSYSAPVTVTMGAEPSVLMPDQMESKYLLAVFYDTLAGNSAQAMTDVSTLLASQPQNIRGLMAKGELLEASGDAGNALSSYDTAVDAFYEVTPNPPEPPVELLEQSASLRNAAISQAAALPAPQVSLQLQNFAQTSPGIYGLDLQVTNNGAGVANNVVISQITFATVSGSGQVSLDASVPSQLPASVDTLAAGASTTVHVSLSVPAGVSTFTATEAGAVQNVIGSSWPVSGSQTVYVVTAGPAITSGNMASFQVGAPGSFAVMATGAPPPALSESGALPNGVSFTDGGGGAATIAGTPAPGSGGAYGLTLQASNGIGTGVSQSFMLAVNEGPAITSANATTFTAGSAGSFGVKATGFPVPTLGESGTLPNGVSFASGTGALGGTPGTGSGGVYMVAFSAANTLATATQTFTLTINEAPHFTSAGSATFTAGIQGSFTVTTTGFPTSSLMESGALPSGISFVDNRNGSATLSGTTAVSGTFTIIVMATNGVGSPAAQTFTLTVAPANSLGLSVTPANIDFGNVRLFRLEARQITLLNPGTTSIAIDKISLAFGAHTDLEDFFFLSSCKSSLAPGKSCVVEVFFFADDLGAHVATLMIAGNTSNSPQTVTLVGTAIR